MIISLYESNYPTSEDKEPDWQNLPVGFFEVDQRKISTFLSGKRTTKIMGGVYIYSHGFTPRIGEYHQAAFSFKRENYLYLVNLTYSQSEVRIMRKQSWDAALGFIKLLKKWQQSD